MTRRILPKHFRCHGCEHRWTLTGEQQLTLRRMTPVCPECGGMDVSEAFLGARRGDRTEDRHEP